MKISKIKISEVKINPNNPRLIKDDKFLKLVNSIKEFPEMLDIRPIVVNKDMIVLGDNMKFIPLFDFDKFDVLDFDAYGSPYNQLNVVFLKNFRGPVHCTFIQSGMGSLNKKMLIELGYSEAMQKKIKSIFNKNGMQKMQDYLSLHGVKWIKGYFYDRKNYFWFCLDK